MNKEKGEALYISAVFYIVFAFLFILLSFAFRNDNFNIGTIINSIFAIGCSSLSFFYNRSENDFFILNILSILLLAPILVVLTIIDICYNIIVFISRLIKGGGEND